MNKVCFSVACAAVLFGFTSFAEGETVAEGATINIPEGRALKVGTAVYDGATLSAGTHTADDAPFITGGGSLKVAHGMMLILK